MSQVQFRATAEVKTVPNKSRPGQSHGFQVCEVVQPDGRFQVVEMYFDPGKGDFALKPGDYLIKPGAPKVVKDRLVIYPEFTPVAAGK